MTNEQPAPTELGVTITEDNLHEFVAWEEDYYQRIDDLTALIKTTVADSGIDPAAAARRDPVIIVNALDAQHPDWQERYPGSDFETALYAYRMEPDKSPLRAISVSPQRERTEPMTDPNQTYFDDLDAWDTDDYDSADEAVGSISNDIVFRPPEPPPPPAAIAAWWHARRNQRRVAPSDARLLSQHIASELAATFLRDLVTPDHFDNHADTYLTAVDTIADRMISHAPRDLDRLETEITDADDPHCQPIAEHLNQCLNQIAALSPTDVRLSTDAADAWRDSLE